MDFPNVSYTVVFIVQYNMQ